MLRGKVSQSRAASPQLLFFIAALALVTAGGLWLWGNRGLGAASSLSSAPPCTYANQSDCIASVSATSRGSWTRTSCFGWNGCIREHYLAVVFANGQVENVQIDARSIPSPEFDNGQPLVIGMYNGVVETVQGPYQTELTAFANPSDQVANLHRYALIVAAVGVAMLVLGWLGMRRSRGTVLEGAEPA